MGTSARRDGEGLPVGRHAVGEAVSETMFSRFVKSAPVGLVLCERDGRITLVNPRIEEEFGYGAEELLGRPIEVLLPERLRDTHVVARERYATDPRPRSVAGRELTGRRKDGSEFPVEVGLSSYGEGDDLVLSAIVIDISERKAAEAEIRRSAERLEILHQIDRAILASASIDEVVGSALERIHDLVGAERAAFVWFDLDERVGVYLGAIEESDVGLPAGRTRIPLEDFPSFTLDPKGPSTYLIDLQEWPERSPLMEIARRAGLRSVVAATIVQEGRVVGDLIASSTRPSAFSEGDRTAIEEVASLLSIAVRQVQLREELASRAVTLEARERQQAAVARLGLLALEESDLGVVFHEATRAVAETLGVPLAKVLELLPDEDALVLRAGVGWSNGEVGRTTVPAGADSQAGFTLTSGWPVVVEDLATEIRFHGPRLLTDHDVVSGLSVIIGAPSAPWGVLGAHTRERRAFSVEDVHFLVAVAEVLGAAVERARARDEIVRRTRRLEGLREIDAQMLSAASPVAVAEAVLDVIHRQISCDRAAVWVRELDSTITFLAVWDRGEAIRGLELGSARPSGDVVPAGLDGVDLYEPDIRAFEASSPILDEGRDAGMRSLLVCNLVVSDVQLGAITVASEVVDAFDREQRETVREAADHLALAIRKARLDQELVARAEDLRRLAEERRKLLAAIVRAQEEERQRIGRELHDGLGQVLTSVSLFAGDLEERVSEDLRPRAARVRELVGKAIADSRTLVWSLHPPELDRLGLVAALEHLVADVSEQGRAHVELHEDVGALRMAVEAQAVVYRIVQEALNNAQKHSGAGSMSVVLTREADDLLVLVKDDGRGFDPERTDGMGIGMPGMRERAELIGGSLVVESAEGAGTTIRLAVPFDA